MRTEVGVMFRASKNWPLSHKIFFMPNSVEHEIFSANTYENAN